MTAISKTLTEDEAHKLLTYLKNDHNTPRQQSLCVRNYVMACVMLEAGLRVGEVVKLKIKHLWFVDQPVTYLGVTSAIAKNKKPRSIPVSECLKNAIRFLHEDFWSVLHPEPEFNAFLFSWSGKPMTTRQVERILCNAGMKALNRPVNPHMLRHTFATRLMRVTNIRTVQILLGHSNLSSTQVYTHPNGEDLKHAIDAMHSGLTNEKGQGGMSGDIPY